MYIYIYMYLCQVLEFLILTDIINPYERMLTNLQITLKHSLQFWDPEFLFSAHIVKPSVLFVFRNTLAVELCQHKL
jgi:hypothetical protein